MPTTKIEAFHKQFPFVSRFLPRAPIARVYVSRIEPDLLNYPLYYFGFNMWAREGMYLLDEDGEEVTRIRSHVTRRKKWVLFGPLVPKTTVWTIQGSIIGREEHSDTVIGKLLELGPEAEKVTQILSYCRTFETVIVYKAPKGKSICQWVREQTEDEAAKIRQECEAIASEKVG